MKITVSRVFPILVVELVITVIAIFVRGFTIVMHNTQKPAILQRCISFVVTDNESFFGNVFSRLYRFFIRRQLTVEYGRNFLVKNMKPCLSVNTILAETKLPEQLPSLLLESSLGREIEYKGFYRRFFSSSSELRSISCGDTSLHCGRSGAGQFSFKLAPHHESRSRTFTEHC